MGFGPGICGKCCKPCGFMRLITPLCDGPAPQANGADGVTVVFKDGSGTTIGTVVSSGQLGALNVAAGGTGYTSVPTVVIGAPPAGGTQATAKVTISSGIVTTATIINPGAGYTSSPTVTLSGGGGSGAIVTRTFVHGSAVQAAGPGTYSYTASKAGYNDVTGTITMSSTCAFVSISTPAPLNSTIPGWPITPLFGTDSVFGSHTLTNAGSYTTTVTATGTLITNCGTNPFATTTGSYVITYKLTYSTCGITLLVSWKSCIVGCSTPITGSPPIDVTVVPTQTCGPQVCAAGPFMHAAVVVSSPLYLEFHVPPLTGTCFGAPWPYPSGAVISYTP